MSTIDPVRAQKLGKLIQEARLFARRTVADCGQVLGLTPEAFEAVEAGELDISLPDLEALAIYLDVPMGYFWGKVSLPQREQVNFSNFLMIRQRIVAAVLRQMRLQARKSVADVAEALGVDEETIEAYESGNTAVPYLHLEKICQFLDSSVDDFVDDTHGPLMRHEFAHQAMQHIQEMDAEMRAFVANPRNLIYLQTAKKLSEMDVRRLRQVAESILDITL